MSVIELDAKFGRMFKEVFDEKVVFNKTLGFKLEQVFPNVVSTFQMRRELVGHYLKNRLHGGVVTSALDVVGGFEVMSQITQRHCEEDLNQIAERVLRVSTIDLRVDFLREGIGSSFRATAECTRLGSRVGSTQMKLFNENHLLIATGSAVYVI